MVFNCKYLFALLSLLPLVLLSPSCNQCDPRWSPSIPNDYHIVWFSFISLSTGGSLIYNDESSPYQLKDLRVWELESNRTVETYFESFSEDRPYDNGAVYAVLDSIPNNMGKITKTYGIQLADLPYREYEITFHIYRPECEETGFFAEAFLDGELHSPDGGRIIFD